MLLIGVHGDQQHNWLDNWLSEVSLTFSLYMFEVTDMAA
jgi:hypothetical protein